MIYEYDHDLCPDKASQPVRGVPAFVIEDEVSYGMKTNEQLKEMMI